ncbi:uncharacterized protein N0V89_012015 [Didymosphaeria variabile]|uniref:Uncharacterized protein n=1 Tax=Didymosphaeria variabile TaxID=1932322 RepID=A0A9W8XBA1_9PLEO|nr:uncharacterized protein N0V89_012015 [Didymosphaeria variabile]KAJ4345879.1 hypothetical protein N0V89_012015 [Didymosphaeria variabile]
MALPSYFKSVPRSGRESQAHRQCPAVAQDGIAPDEYPTFTRPSSPELDGSKRYTDDAPKRKRTHPWTFRRDSNSESGDDCDRPLARRLSRKASTVLHKFTPQRTRSDASSARAQSLPEGPEEADEHVEPVAKRRHFSAERRRSSLQKLKDLINKVHKDSAAPTKTFLPAPPLDEDDRDMGLMQRSCSGKAPSLAAEDPELIYMAGALPAPASEDSSGDGNGIGNGNISLDPLLNPNLTESKHRKASTAAASLDSDYWVNAATAATSIDVDMDDGREVGLLPPASLTGYSPPPNPKNKRARHYPYNALPNFPNRRNSLKRQFSLSSKSQRRDMTTALSNRHIAPWDPLSTTSSVTQPDSTSVIGVLPSLSSETTISHISIPTFNLPQSPASHPEGTDQCPASPSNPPTEASEEKAGSTFTPPSPCTVPPPSTEPHVSETYVSLPALHQRDTLNVPDVDTHPSTAADSTFSGEELRLRRSGSLRRSASALTLDGMEGLEGFEYVQRALGWSGNCGCVREGCGCEERGRR